VCSNLPLSAASPDYLGHHTQQVFAPRNVAPRQVAAVAVFDWGVDVLTLARCACFCSRLHKAPWWVVVARPADVPQSEHAEFRETLRTTCLESRDILKACLCSEPKVVVCQRTKRSRCFGAYELICPLLFVSPVGALVYGCLLLERCGYVRAQ